MPVAKDLDVLVVDDHESIRGLAISSLNQIGIAKVAEAADGAAALEQMKQKRFHLVICDWHMDGMDGLELLKTLRANPILKRTPFIILTARNDPASVREAVTAGVNNYIVKPFDAPTLKSKVEAVLGKLT